MPSKPVALPCAYATLRRATRAVSHIYDEALRPSGLRGTQFTLLQALDYAGPITQGRLGAALAVDSTTLSRTLALVEQAGWVESAAGEDRRERHLSLTPAGLQALETAKPFWQGAQDRLHERLGDAMWRTLFSTADQVTESVLD